MAQTVKNTTAIRETWARSLGWEDPLEKEMATHSYILAWRVPIDRGAWQATVPGVTESDTIERLSTSSEPLSKDQLYPCPVPGTTSVSHGPAGPQAVATHRHNQIHTQFQSQEQSPPGLFLSQLIRVTNTVV